MEKMPLALAALIASATTAFAAEYKIGTLEELREFMEAVHVEDFAGDTVTLTADIDCEGGRFNTGASGSSAYSCFKGTFDGQGHVISNFVNTALSAGTGNTPTFGVAMFDIARDGAVIKNLTLRGHFGNEELHDYVAPFAAYAIGHTNGTLGLTLENCHFIGSVTNYKNAAAFVGTALHGSGAPDGRVLYMTNCTARGSIISTWVYTSGGLVADGAGVEAYDCSVEGVIHGGQSGGLVGEAHGGCFTRCSFEGTMRPDRSSVSGCLNGGLVGEASNTVFRACTAVVELLDSKAASAGGAAAVTFGNTAFYDCSATVEATVPIGRYGGFVGWTAGAEVFSNCTASLTAIATPVINYDAGTTNIYSLTTGGFAASVASDGALFVDCTASAGGGDLKAGFYYNQEPFSKDVTVGSNTFRRCHAVDSAAKEAGFCAYAWNCAFEGCTVRGGTGAAGFVGYAGQRPDNKNSSTYPYAQTSTFTDCSVSGTRAGVGFVNTANSGNKNASTNVFRRCRASCVLEYASGFASLLNKGTIAEDCIGHGVSAVSSESYGFVSSIDVGATVRRCVGAVLPLAQGNWGAGFAGTIPYSSPVEDCYSVYAPPIAKTEYNSYGSQGGFVKRASVGYNDLGPAVTRCFALAAPPDGSESSGSAGSFCGNVYNTSYANFVDCWRPAESNLRDVGNGNNGGDDAGVGALTKAQFANATAATMQNYDFQNVWHAPRGVASSPYLDASVDANTNFWFLAAILGGEGRILVNDGEPAEAYPAGTVLTVEAVPDTPGMPFAGWVGEGFADPTARRTTYTVKNVSAIGASFCTPIYTVADWTNVLSCASVSAPSGNYALMNDLDFTGLFESNGWQNVRVGSFTGKFFGQGHTISNLCTTRGDFSSTVALFRKVSSGAEIRDLTVYSSNVTNDQNTLSMAGLVNEVESGVTISNCHTVVDWQGVYPGNFYSGALASCKYYGLAQTVSGLDIRIVDCTVRGRLAGGTQACGFVGSATLNGGEIARCAVFADVSTLTNRTDGMAAGFAGSLSLSGGAVVRECFSAGVVDAAANAAGFAYEISMRDDESQVRDCYSTAEVISGAQQNPAGFASRIADINDEGGVLPVANCWFGGTVRVRGKASDYYKPYGFAYYLDGDVSFENCAWIETPGANEAGTEGVTALPQAASRLAASWPGYDFGNVWSMTDGSTTPYFAWSLTTNGAFRVLAQEEPGTVIAHPATAAPGGAAAIEASAEDADLFFCQWAGGATYTNAAVNPSAAVADNHRAVRCVWGKAISTPEQLAAIADDPAGTYALAADIDLNGLDWTPICQDEYTPFTGTFYGNGHTISNLTVDTDGSVCAGLFGRLQDGATVLDLHLVNPVVRGVNCVGTLAGYVNGANISGCTVVGADVAATSERAGCFVGQIEGATSVSRCSAVGDIAGEGRYTGGFVGSAEGSAAIEKCYALGSVKGTGGEGFGGFVGYAAGDSVSFSECFACGAVAASERNSVGGFVGYVGDAPAFTDCYALVDAKGGSYVGGFAGQLNYCNTVFERCYAAGSTVGSSEAGGFAGRQYRGSPSFTDCFRPADGLPDLGTSSTDLVGIDALDAAGFLDSGNFDPYLDTGKWTQVDGKTQPYFAWGLQDGKMTLSGSISGTGGGSIAGLGAYAPGTVVNISAVPAGSVFLGWLGNAPYADASAQTTAVPLDNFRIVTAEFGKLISSREELEEIADNPAGSYALGADIDISDGDWTPLGNNSTPFTGSLYAQGHKITGLRVAGTSDYAGLFRCVKDATLDGIHLEGVSVSGRQYTGALAGDVQGATTIRNCSAEGVVSNNYGYAGLLVGRVYGSGTTFDHCAATGTVVAASQDTGGLVGGVYYYPVTFADCDVDVFVTGTSGNNKGGFIGSVRDSNASATFARCTASGDLVATNNSSNIGGFIGYANRLVSFEDCAAFGDVGGRGSTGGFAGKTESAVATYVRCSASGTVVNWSSSCAGGFVGAANGQNSRFKDCAALGPLVNSTSSQTGGFAGYTGGSGIVFADCSAAGDVRSTSSQTGGFVGYVNASNVLERCVAEGAVSGTSQTGGFVGQANGDRSQYLSCVANGSVAGTGNQAGGFVGQIGSTGLRFANCSALGSATSTSYDVGGFVGYVSGANAFWRCFSAGSATASHEVGGFLGYNNGGGTTATECFALGDATATRTGNDAIAGGFLGYGYYGVGFTDCYCLGTVKGERVVGGFAGRLYDSGNVFTRCYAAGALDCTGTYAGAFVGYPQRYGAITDCAALCTGDLHAFGTGTAGTSEAKESIAEYDAAGMKDSDNFQTWLAIDDADGAVWTQADGVTQPYLSWSSPDGDLMVYASVGGSASGRIDGAGVWYAPGDNATVTAVPDGGFFVTWTGSTPYADPSSPTTTIALDNHRVAAVQFGKLITTADELDAVRNDLGGIYGLGADIDLLGRPWTPLGDNSKKFTGKFYGFGHEVMNMVATNNPNSGYKGLFGYTDGAVLDGVTVSGTAKCNSGYYYVGGLVGRADATSIANCHATATVEGGRYVGGLVGGVNNGTSVIGCSASGTVKSTGNYGYSGGFAGGCESGAFEIRDSVSSAEVTAVASYVGGFIGYVSSSGASVISGCRADGYAGGNGDVGGFVGYVSASLTISDCVARGDVRSSGSYYGGFVGRLNHASATIANCWCSGPAWGTGGTIGAFIGKKASGTIQNCSIYAYGVGPRPFCGSDANMAGGSLTASQIDVLTADWPKVKLHVEDATPISTAEELLAVTNNLSGIYVLTKDIDLEGAAWTPIGNASAGFTGEFYGENHCISNFVVNSSVSGAGLFGCIAGGRVNGVRAYGSVTGSNQQVGGFVGRLAQMSLVDGCSFSGTVSGSQYVVGGFAGRICDSPVVLRSCAVNCTVTFTGEGGSYKSAYAGGFVGAHDAGYVMDCYAVADVSSVNQAQYVGGFAGNVSSGRITTSWCAASVEGTGNNRGAFAGSATLDYITKSYYDSGKTSLLAVNNAAYTGITPLTSSEMLHAANFPVFDFDRTWLIDEGATYPYLQTFIVVKRGFDVWTEQVGYPEGTEPGDVVDGIPAGIRYVYSIPADATGLYALSGEGFFHVVMDAYGNPCVKFRAKRDPYEGVRVIETVYATTDLTDMAESDSAKWQHRVQMRHDILDDTWKPADGVVRPAMFFKWSVEVERVEE